MYQLYMRFLSRMLTVAKKTAGKQPYSKSERARAKPKTAKGAADVQLPCTSLQSSASTPQSSSLPFEVELAREMYTECFHKMYPHVTPRNDYDIIRLSTRRQKGTAAELYAWVDKEMEEDIKEFGSRKAVMSTLR